jgi:hypothetical protein
VRLTDDRYTRERERCELGLRLLRHEARTCLILACTGISEDRVRKLYKTYLQDRTPTQLRRKRGKAPQELKAFVRNTDSHLEASLLAGILRSLELIDASAVHPQWRPTPQFGTRFCDAYEYYLACAESALFNFEHAWFLMLTLARGQLSFTECPQCGAACIQDVLATLPRPCPFCAQPIARIPVKGRRTPALALVQGGRSAGNSEMMVR